MRTEMPHFARSLLPAIAVAVTLAALPAHADVTVRRIDQDLDTAGARSVGFHADVGELHVVATSGSSVRARIELLCERENDTRCRGAAQDVKLRIRHRGDRLQLAVDDWPKLPNKRITLRARIEVPRDLDLEIDMGVGEITVRGMERDVEVDVGVGEVSIEMAEAAVREVHLDTGVGEVEMQVGGRTIDGTGFVSSHLTWRHGPGSARVEVDAGVGEIAVILQ